LRNWKADGRALGSAVSRSGMDEVNGCRAAIYACDALLALAQNRLAGFFEITRWMGRHVVENGCAIEQLGFAISIGPLQLDNGSYAVNPEGADKALLPYFQRDINSGALNTTPGRLL
jgi:hypothetical protein